MSKISLLTPISFEREASYSEKTLSTLSHYFYLGGTKAVVIKKNEARLEKGTVPFLELALKVSSYIVLFPLTLTFFTLNLYLHQKHKFTVITPSSEKPGDDTTHKTSSVFKNSDGKKPDKTDEPIEPFSFLTFGENPTEISSLSKMSEHAREISRQARAQHKPIYLTILEYPKNREQTLRFVEELKKVADVTEMDMEDTLFLNITPIKTEEKRKDRTILTYESGIVEEIHASSDHYDRDNWRGKRTYPNGTIETGKFEMWQLTEGTRVENGEVTYLHPDPILWSKHSDKCIIEDEIEGKKQLVVLHIKPGFHDAFAFVPTDENPYDALINILSESKRNFREDKLENILSGPINCEEFVKFIFETRAVFSLQPYPVRIILETIRKNKIDVDIHIKHPETNESFLHYFISENKILKTLLLIDPTLIRRDEGVETAFVLALLKANGKGAEHLLETMNEQEITLTPRELLFKNLASNEEEVSLEELCGLSIEDKIIAYKLANISANLNVLRKFRDLSFGRKEELMMREGPSIFGCNMDALERYETLGDFLKELRSQKILFTNTEFKKSPTKNFDNIGNNIGSILGKKYIERKIEKLGLIHCKVPKKILVINDVDGTLELDIDDDLNIQDRYENGFTVYEEKIKPSDRQITPEEVSEILQLVEATGYTDIKWKNFTVAEDGVYITNTDFRNFWVKRAWFKKGRRYLMFKHNIVSKLPAEQGQSFIDELTENQKTYQKREKDLLSKQKEQYRKEIEELKKTGCIYGSECTFSLDEILNSLD